MYDILFFFFFSSRRRHTRCGRDWSSDVCSSDLDFTIIYNTLQKDTANSEKEAVEVIYRQLRNAEPPDFETARSVFEKLFFSEIGRDTSELQSRPHLVCRLLLEKKKKKKKRNIQTEQKKI